MENGIAIALAWPETYCKQAGAWYDVPMQWLNINKNNYYKAGHSAIVLVDVVSGDCHYYDFGRYHAPHGSGRVRSAVTDHELEIKTKAKVTESGVLENYRDILEELYGNKSCHGSGAIHAAYCNVNLEQALEKARAMQEMSPIPYGPFLPQGTNCSRFVSTVILSGSPGFIISLLLKYPKTISPAPMGNVYALKNYRSVSDWKGVRGPVSPDSLKIKTYPDEQGVAAI